MERKKIDWQDRLSRSKKFFKEFIDDANYLNNMYRASGNTIRNGAYVDSKSTGRVTKQNFAVLWSTVGILHPSIYQKAPVAWVDQKFNEDDEVGIATSEILENVINYIIGNSDTSISSYNKAWSDIALSYLICGIGITRIDYSPIVYEDNDVEDRIVIKYISYRDFLCSPCDNWNNTTWVAFRNWMSTIDFREQFDIDPDKYTKGEQDLQGFYQGKDKDIHQDRIAVWDIWDKETKKVYYIVDGSFEVISERDDPLGLDGFFPCSRPLFANATPETIIPVPDYKQYVTQAKEIDNLTSKIVMIGSAIRARGCYDASVPEIARIFDELSDNELIPVKNWAELTRKGGIAQSIQMLPIAEYATTLGILYDARDRAEQSLDKIARISDSQRGSSEIGQTATSQTIISQNSDLQLKSRQNDVIYKIGDDISIIGEIVVKHFSKKTILSISNFEYEENYTPELFDKCIKLMRDVHNEKYRISIETDSIMSSDETSEQSSRMEFINTVIGYLGQASTMNPMFIPLMSKMLMFGARSFKAGRSLLQDMDSMLKTIEKNIEEQQKLAQQESGGQPGAGGAMGAQTVINQEAPQPLQPRDLLKSDDMILKQEYETLRLVIKLLHESGTPMAINQVNEAMNAINQTNKESNLQALQLGMQSQPQQQPNQQPMPQQQPQQ